MKKTLSIFLALSILLTPIASIGDNIPGYEGGIQNESTYKEVLFITGEPIVLEGTLTVKINEGRDDIREQYIYRLENIEKDVKLNRTVKLRTTENKRGNQATISKRLENYKENVQIDGQRYNVRNEDYQWNQGTVEQNSPIVAYSAGDWSARKTYIADKGREEITVDTIGHLVGYDSPWSATETQRLNYTINYREKTGDKKTWEGTATVDSSYNRTKDYNYVENVPNQISFKGGFLLTDKEDNVLKYSYDLPKEGEGRNIGENSFSIDTNPIITRLNIPRVRDVLGLPNEKEILLLASMDAFPLESTYLGPEKAMSRGDFARAILKAMGIEPEKEEEPKRNKRRRRKDTEEKQATYVDVRKDHRNYDYIEEVTKRKIMSGIGQGRFAPDKPLTKTEAITTVIKALGFQNLAPIKNYSTGFRDDRSIPKWAKGNIYMAKNIGIVESGGYFHPHKKITKEEASELIVRFINYLQDNLKHDYRENILDH